MHINNFEHGAYLVWRQQEYFERRMRSVRAAQHRGFPASKGHAGPMRFRRPFFPAEGPGVLVGLTPRRGLSTPIDRDHRGRPHREDGPALRVDEGEAWYRWGLRHRVGGPAVAAADGTQMWYQRGYLHRIDGPAVEHPDGSREWYRFGRLHNTEGPALEEAHAHGFRVWSVSGQQAHDLVLRALLEAGMPVGVLALPNLRGWRPDWPQIYEEALRQLPVDRAERIALYLIGQADPAFVSVATRILATRSAALESDSPAPQEE